MRREGPIAVKLRTIGYYFRQAGQSMKRNLWISLAAISTVAISAFLVGVFYLLVLNANFIADNLEANIEVVAFVEAETSRVEVLEIQKQIEALPNIASATLVPKEEGLRKLHSRYGEERDLLGALGGENPLPDYFVIKVKESERIGEAAGYVAQTPRIYKVEYGQKEVEKLFAISNKVRIMGSGLIALLTVAGIFLIATTVRLTVFARRKELQVMKLVGATDWFVRWPFFLEGLILGTLGAVIASLGVYFGYASFVTEFTPEVAFLDLITDPMAVYKVLVKLLAGGAVVGALGSLISMQRFLKV